MKRILVTGAGGSAAFNFIDSLRNSKEKIYIVGTDSNLYHLELANSDKKYIVPNVSSPKYLSKINEIILKEKIDFVHPQPDVEVLFFSKNKEKLKAKIFIPKQKTVELSQNKLKLLDLLVGESVPVAQSYRFENEKSVRKILSRLLSKNEKVWIRAISGSGSKGSLPVTNFKQAIGWISYWEDLKGLKISDFMASEFLPGREFAFQSIWRDGNLIVSSARQRIEYIFGNISPSGQTSSPSVAMTVNNNKVNEVASKAVLALDSKADGVFCVDLKESKSGLPCVTEINAGRFFTTSNFFSYAGVNMPYYYVKIAFGEKIPSVSKYNAVEKDIYWIRMVDMGKKLIKKNKWTSEKI